MALNRTRAACHLQAHHAFTMVELLVVIGIIGLLVGLSLVVGSQVMGGAKVRATEETLRVLDQALQEYINAEGDNPPPIYEVPGSNAVFPVADARDMTNAFTPPAGSGGLPGHQMLNSVGFFYAQASKVSAAKAVLDNLPARYVRMYDPDGTGTGDQPSLMTVFDAWGRPIRYVHPVWQGVIAGDITAASPTYTQPRSAAAARGQDLRGVGDPPQQPDQPRGGEQRPGPARRRRGHVRGQPALLLLRGARRPGGRADDEPADGGGELQRGQRVRGGHAELRGQVTRPAGPPTMRANTPRGVAQLGSASRSGREGRWFKSSHPDIELPGGGRAVDRGR